MGATESKGSHRKQPNKHIRHKKPPSVNHKSRQKTKHAHIVTQKNETIGKEMKSFESLFLN